MKYKLFFIALNLISLFAAAQQIPKTVLAEHFTNTYCSICASRNPGLYSNLSAFPQVIHLAYYPSAPYAACPLSMHNPTESDARTNYYGIYGGTPQLVVAGAVITGPFTNPSIFSSQLSVTTSFALSTSMSKVGSDSISVKIVVKKVDTSSLSALQLFACIVEDTLSFTAHNGETANYDVFRKAIWGTTSLNITAPVSIGDSSVYTKNVAINATWNLNRLYSVSILQQADKKVVQASKSAHLQVPAKINTTNIQAMVSVHPNPATDKLYIDRQITFTEACIINEAGAVVKRITEFSSNSIDVSTLKIGTYYLILNEDGHTKSARFIKK